ncbi:uncharacterized protein LOC144179912 [Haemaphysalis longicornis]
MLFSRAGFFAAVLLVLGPVTVLCADGDHGNAGVLPMSSVTYDKDIPSDKASSSDPVANGTFILLFHLATGLQLQAASKADGKIQCRFLPPRYVHNVSAANVKAIYGRTAERRKYSSRLQDDDLDNVTSSPSKDWESKLAASYENFAADSVYDTEDLQSPPPRDLLQYDERYRRKQHQMQQLLQQKQQQKQLQQKQEQQHKQQQQQQQQQQQHKLWWWQQHKQRAHKQDHRQERHQEQQQHQPDQHEWQLQKQLQRLQQEEQALQDDRSRRVLEEKAAIEASLSAQDTWRNKWGVLVNKLPLHARDTAF